MYARALVVSLVLAATVAAVPLRQEGSDWLDLKDSLNDIGNSESLETTRDYLKIDGLTDRGR
ncbi:hypothetical protein RRF57_006602 [Xylaria bambusicola]|uniref:Uncharacterized protein n=1 Tax=Xylaria bambusicola TaxID=326684 RepID=A0AAN7Z5P6_9PEZI